MGWQQTIQRMVDGYDSQVSNISKQITSLQNKASDTQDQLSAVNEVTKIATSGLTGYLDLTKKGQIAGKIGTTENNIHIQFGNGYGVTNLTSWYMIWNGIGDNPPVPGKIVYSYRRDGWDGDSTIICLLQEFGFLKDYMNVNINTGLYGLDSLLNLLDGAVDKLETMISKYETAKRRFEAYLTTGASGCLLNPFF